MQLLVRELALLALAHEGAELGEVELAVVVSVGGVALRGVLLHAVFKRLVALAGRKVVGRRHRVRS